MNKQFDIEFSYKGNRKYVHGTDIYTKLIHEYNHNIKKIDLAFHGITVNNMTFSSKKPEDKEVKVTFKCIDIDEKTKLYGVENSVNINNRYEYFEERIVENSEVDVENEKIILKTLTEYVFIEHIVAMNKALLERLYSDVNGKWYFTRLQLDKPRDTADIKSLQLILKSNFQFKLTKSAIVFNGEEVGFIYFSLIKEDLS